jgi:dienelactone hydrolase
LRSRSASIDLTVYSGVHHACDVAQLKPGRSSAGRWLEFDEPAARDAKEKTRAFSRGEPCEHPGDAAG